MTYQRNEWRDGDPTTPLSAERLNGIEAGLYNLSWRLGESEETVAALRYILRRDLGDMIPVLLDALGVLPEGFEEGSEIYDNYQDLVWDWATENSAPD